jgi:hypothetical protein
MPQIGRTSRGSVRRSARHAEDPTANRLTVTADRLADRRAHYFMDQQIGLHGTIVSIALGVAGLAAASLLQVRAADRPYHGLLWLLWIASLLGVSVVYSGMTVSVYVLPSTIPSAADMFLPFAVGLSEFMLFAVLTTPLTAQLGPRSLIALWFACLCLFGCFASIIIQRMRRLFKRTDYDPPPAANAVYDVADLMRRDLRGASGTALVSAAATIAIGLFPAVPIDLAYLFIVPLIFGMSYGVYNQRRQAQILEAGLSRLPAVSTGQGSSFEWFSRSPNP